mgnify:CR=1 FL=1
MADMKNDTFVNFCTGMQCSNIPYNHVITVLNELSIVADTDGYDKTIIIDMLEKLNTKSK